MENNLKVPKGTFLNVTNYETIAIEITAGTVLYIYAHTLLYLIGVYIHVKIIAVCWNDSDCKAWQIHLINSVSMTICYTFYLPFWTITYAIPNLTEKTGEWFCYLASLIIMYGFYVLTFNSLIIAIIKYFYIVKFETARRSEDQKIKKIFSIIFITFPLLLSCITTTTKDFKAFTGLSFCFLQSKQKLGQNVGFFRKMIFCNPENKGPDHILYLIKQVICGTKNIITSLINTNILEAFFYYKIFKKMKW